MAMSLPSNPAEGDVVYCGLPGSSLVYRGGLWARSPISTALPKNYLVNPSFMVSQQNGRAASPVADNGQHYVADQWLYRWSTPGCTLSAQSVATDGVVYNYINGKFTVGTRKATTAATDYMIVTQNIEAARTADWQWGTAKAKQLVLSLVQNGGTFDGPFAIRIANHDSTRSFVMMFDQYQRNRTFVIPGDTTGTWPTDSASTVRFDITYAIGSNWRGVAGWQNGNIYADSTMGNGMNASFPLYLTDLGLYLDPYKTGVAPAFARDGYANDLRRSQRYWYKAFGLQGHVVNGTQISRAGMKHPVPMRAAPAATVVGAPRAYDLVITTPVTGVPGNYSNAYALELDLNTGGTFSAGGYATTMYYQDETHYIAVNARPA